MEKERLHAIHLAKVELGWLSTLAHALNTETSENVDWKQAKKEFEMRGCTIDNEDLEEEHKQVDMFGTFVNCTLCWDKKCGYYINYGWVLDDYNTDLYAHGFGYFRPYYDERTRKEWEQL